MYKPLVDITSKYTIGAFEERRRVNSASISSELGRSFSFATVVSPFGTCRMKACLRTASMSRGILAGDRSMLIKRRDAVWQGKAILYRSNNHTARVTVLFPVNASAQSADHFQLICTLPVPLQRRHRGREHRSIQVEYKQLVRSRRGKYLLGASGHGAPHT